MIIGGGCCCGCSGEGVFEGCIGEVAGIGEVVVGDWDSSKLSISELVNPFSWRNAVFWASGALWRSACWRNSEAALRMEGLEGWDGDGPEAVVVVGGGGVSGGDGVCVSMGSSFTSCSD